MKFKRGNKKPAVEVQAVPVELPEPIVLDRPIEYAIACCGLLQDHIDDEEKQLSSVQLEFCCQVIEKRSKKDFFFFSKYVLGFDLMTEQTHKIWADNLMTEFDKRTEKLMRLKPRGCFKTTIYGVCFVLWLWACVSTELKIFYTSSNALLLEEVSDKLSMFLNGRNESIFQLAFGVKRDDEGKLAPKNTGDVFNIVGRSTKGFSLILRTAGGATAGIHPNIVIVDDPCFVGETPVLTSTGYKAIKDILPGEFVLTRKGYKEVVSSGITARNVLVESYNINGCELTMTPTHKIITKNRGKVPTNELNSHDTIIKYEDGIWKSKKLILQKSLNSMESNTEDIQRVNTETTENTLQHPETFRLKKDLFIERFGPRIMEVFQRGFTFTTKKVIMIIPLKIWNSLKAKNIIPFIQKKQEKGRRISITSLISEKKQVTGISQKKAGLKVKEFFMSSPHIKKHAFNVAMYLKPLISIKQHKNFVRQSAKVNIDTGRKRDVYNLTVKDEHEFIANALLVANCDRSDRESKTVRDKKEHWFDSLTPLLVPFLFKDGSELPVKFLLFIATRWHMNDLMHYIFELNKKTLDWDIEIESIYNSEGTSNYPEFITDEAIGKIQSSISTVFFACNTGEAPVLMNDFNIKEIKDIRKGDKIIGFTLAEGMQNKSRLTETEVLETKSRMADVVKITLESGRVIRCTADHKWFNGRSNKDSHSIYTPAKVGKNLLRVVDCHYKPTFEELLDWRWLGGMLDGEGSVNHGQFSLHQSYMHHPGVCDKIEEVLTNLGLTYKIYERKDKIKQYQYQINGGRDVRVKAIRYGNCGKKEQLVNSILHGMSRTVYAGKSRDPQIGMTGGRDKVISIEPDGHEMVYSMQTTTGNYVVWGYASKNCQYENNPLPEGLRLFNENCLHYTRYSDLDMMNGQKACFFDPSEGEEKSDWPATIWTNFKDNKLTIFSALNEKMILAELIHYIAYQNKVFGVNVLVFEKSGSSLIKQAFEDAHKAIGHPIRIIEITHHTNKDERITFMQPDLYSGFCSFLIDYEDRYPVMMKQLFEYPANEFDDYPDVIEMSISYYRQDQFVFTRYARCS